MLAVPDAAYQQWIVRLDLHRIAMYGFPTPEIIETRSAQEDHVLVTPKKREATRTAE